MCRKKIISIVFSFVLLGIFAVMAKAQTVTPTALPESTQAILPNSGNFAVFGINGSDEGDGDTSILSITVRFDQSPPGSDFNFSMTDISRVAIYQDGDAGGVGNGNFSSADTLLEEVFSPFLFNTVTITFSTPYPLPDSDTGADAGNDLFVVINTSNTIGDDDPSTEGNEGHAFTVTIPINGILLDWYPDPPVLFPSDDQTTETIYCEAWAADLTPVSTQHGLAGGDYLYPGTAYVTGEPSRYPYSVPDEWIRPRYDTNPLTYEPVNPTHFPIPQLLPIETRTPILGIDCGGGSSGAEYDNSNRIALDSITVTFTALSDDFDPTTGFDQLRDSGDGSGWWPFSGVALYEGDWTDTANILRVNYSGWQGNWPEWTLTIYPDPVLYEDRLIKTTWDEDDGFDYFIVVRADSGYNDESGEVGDGEPIKYGAAFKAYIKQEDVKFSTGNINTSPNPSQPYISESEAKPIIPVLEIRDLVSPHDDYPQRIDATSPATPVFGINITDTTDARAIAYNNVEVLKWVSVYLYDESTTTDTSDFMTLSINQNSGLSLWKDNKTEGQRGVFDSQDTFVPVANFKWQEIVPGSVWKARLDAAQHQEVHGDDVYTEDNRGDDYFVCIRTSDTLSYEDRFSFEIKDGNEYALDGPDGLKLKAQLNAEGTGVSGNILTANFPVFLTDLTTPYQNIIANSPPTPVIGINTWDDTGSGGSLEQVIVEFYNPGGEDDVAFNPEHDLKLLSSGSASGVAIYRDTNGNGVFNSATDTVILLKEWTWEEGFSGQPYDQCRLVFQTPEPLPTSDTGTPDYFVVIRTADSTNYEPDDDFMVGIVSWGPEGSTWGSRALGFIDTWSNQTRSYERIATNVVGNGVVAPVDGDDEGDTDIVDTGIIEESEGSSDGGSLSGCFIATACYGTPMAEEVKILSAFRDEYLLTNSLGKFFVGSYYKVSPQIASYISQHPHLKNLVRIVLKPTIKIVDKFLDDDSSKVILRREK